MMAWYARWWFESPQRYTNVRLMTEKMAIEVSRTRYWTRYMLQKRTVSSDVAFAWLALICLSDSICICQFFQEHRYNLWTIRLRWDIIEPVTYNCLPSGDCTRPNFGVTSCLLTSMNSQLSFQILACFRASCFIGLFWPFHLSDGLPLFWMKSSVARFENSGVQPKSRGSWTTED